MSYTIEKKETEAVLSITLPWDDLKEKFESQIEAASKNVNIKGFRKGKVPQDVAEQQVDRSAVLSDTVDHALKDVYSEAVTKEELKFAGAPQVQVKKLAEGNDVEIEIVAMLMPEVTVPKNWKKEVAKVNKEFADKNVEVTDEEVDAELKQVAESRTEEKEVDRAAKDGDQVKMDFTVKQDGVVIEGGTSKDHALILGKGAFIPGFEEEVIGMKKDEEKTFELSFPEKYHAEHLAGKKASFEVKVNTVEERITPEINDAFAASLGDAFKTLDDLKKNIVDGMTQEKERQQSESQRTQYLEALTELMDIVLPAALVEDELKRMVGEMEQQLSTSGMTFDSYLEQMGKKREEIEEMWKPQAEKRIKSALLLEKLAEDMEINPSSEDIEAEMNKTLGMYQGMKDMEKNIDMQQLYEYTRGMLRNNDLFEQLAKVK